MINRVWIIAAVALALIGFMSRQGTLVILGSLLLITFGCAWFWTRYSLAGVRYERSLSERRVFPGEPVNLVVRVTNKSPLPLAWFECDDEVLADIRMTKGSLRQTSAAQLRYLSNNTPLLWYERVSWHYQFVPVKRGYFRFGPLSLRSGDPFGLFTRYEQRDNLDYLIVYPRVVPLMKYGLPARQPLGERRSDRQIFEDPSRTIGVRDYTSADPFKRIHWTATARRQQLQVKVYEPTTTPQAIVFLNITTFERSMYGLDPALFERAVTLAAAAAAQLIEERYATGLFANTSVVGADQPVKLMPSRDPGQLMLVLEALAKLTVISTSNFEEILVAAGARMPWGATLVLVTGLLEPELVATVLHLRAVGHRLVILFMGELSTHIDPMLLSRNAGQVGSIDLYIVRRSSDEAIELQEITIASPSPAMPPEEVPA